MGKKIGSQESTPWKKAALTISQVQREQNILIILAPVN